MKRPRLGIFTLVLAGLAVLFLFPPFFAVDPTSDGRIHGSLGYHPAWSAPSQERAYAILAEGGVLPDSGVQVSDLAVRRNTVRLTLNALALLVFVMVGFLVLRGRSSAGGSAESLVVGPDSQA